MINELLFLVHIIIISCFALGALKLGKEALIAFICMQCILANLFVIKQTTLFGFTATCSDAFTVGAVFGLNLLQEYFGKSMAKLAIWISFAFMLFYALLSQIHLHYIPSITDSAQIHFESILQFMPRIVTASFLVYLIVQFIDCHLYEFLKNLFQGSYLIGRNYISIMLCQFFDTVLFSFLGLYGIIDNIGEIILVSYLIKMVVMITSTPFLVLSKRIIRK